MYTNTRTYLHPKRAQGGVPLQAQLPKAYHPALLLAATRLASTRAGCSRCGGERGGVHGLEELVEIAGPEPAAGEADALCVRVMW